MNKCLVDTDTFSAISKAREQDLQMMAERYFSIYGQFTFSTVTVMEIVRGYCLAGRLEKLAEFLAGLKEHEVLSFSESTAELAGKIDADLLRTGQPIGRADPMIAATAIEHGLELITRNTKHFERIQALGYPLQLDDWRSGGHIS